MLLRKYWVRLLLRPSSQLFHCLFRTLRAGGGTAVLQNYLYTLTMQDVTAGTTNSFDAVRLIPDNSGYGVKGKTAGVNLATEWGAQNSENLGFTGFLPGFMASNHDLYKFTLTANQLPAFGTKVPGQLASISVFADATSPVPEPATFLLVGLGIGALGLARKRQASRRA